MHIKRHKEKQANRSKYTSEKLKELTTKKMGKLGVLTHAFQSSTQEAKIGKFN